MPKRDSDEGLDIPNRISARRVRKPGPYVAAVIVIVIALMLIHGMVTNPNFDWPTVWMYLFNENVLSGIGWTLQLTVYAMLLATVLAVILAMMRKSANAVLRAVSWFFIWFFRGTPVYTQLVFWGLFSVLVPKIALGVPFGPEFWSFDTKTLISAGTAAVLGLGLNEAAYLSEIVRAGIEAVDTGQSEAAAALGMRRSLIMRRIILPQAMRIIVPPTGNETIGMLKTTSLVLAVPFTLELQFATNAIDNRIYKPIPLLLVACIWYLVITTVLMFA
ncbi:MAG: amino acid ABC transporter permease, partial [Bifidobacterium crudilactis]|uniref:amino acid ABC transporter permease n=1 Tax=Bifidobacterium crudilactis TaxID=327277 RepID=UPI00264708BE